MANNAPYALGPIAPGVSLNGEVINAGTVVYNPPLTKLYVGGTGNITAVMAQTGTVTFTAVPTGSWIKDVAIIQVTTSTATSVLGFW
jgi:hypothetical protein